MGLQALEDTHMCNQHATAVTVNHHTTAVTVNQLTSGHACDCRITRAHVDAAPYNLTVLEIVR